jgi:hypothetical protein
LREAGARKDWPRSHTGGKFEKLAAIVRGHPVSPVKFVVCDPLSWPELIRQSMISRHAKNIASSCRIAPPWTRGLSVGERQQPCCAHPCCRVLFRPR